MIPLLLAAVICQPLDAVYSTSGDPKNCGLAVSLRYPSSWRRFDPGIPHAVVAFGDATTVCVVHEQHIDDFAIIQESWRVETQVFRELLFNQGIGDSYVPTFCKVLRIGEVEGLGDNPIKVIEYSGSDGKVAIHEMLFVWFYERRLVVLRMGCMDATDDQAMADSRFHASLNLFAEILRSASCIVDRKEGTGWLPAAFAAVAVVLLALACAVASHRRFTSSKGSALSSGRRGFRRRRT
jgi:hypothetical protein